MLSLKSQRVSFEIHFMILCKLMIVFGLMRTIASYALRSLNSVQKGRVPPLPTVLIL